MDSYRNLANGIIEQAAKDYRTAKKKLEREPENKKVLWEIKEIRKFFLSGWFKALSDADGNYILEKLDKE